MNRIVTYSSLSTLVECPAKYRWRDTLQLVSMRDSIPKIVGKAFHQSISGEHSNKIIETLKPIKILKDECTFAQWRIILPVLAEAYIDRWGMQEDSFEEVKFEIPLSCSTKSKSIQIKIGRKYIEKAIMKRILKHDYNYCGVVDGIEINTGGIASLIENKTTSEKIEDGKLSDKAVNRLLTEWQTDFYAYALSKKNIQLNQIVYRYIKKPTIKLLKNEAENTYLKRLQERYIGETDKYLAEEVLYAKQNYDDTEQFILNLCRLLEFYEERNFWPGNSRSCSNWSGCAYMPLCNDFEEGQKYFKHEAPHGELK